MKKLLFIALMLFAISFGVNAQNNVPKDQKEITFWGIPFGSSKAKVKQHLLKKGNIEITDLRPGEYENILFLENLPSFAGFPISKGICSFTQEDQLEMGMLVLAVNSEDQVFTIYSSLKSLLEEKYGRANFTKESFESPFKKGDGKELLALKMGKCSYTSRWEVGKGEKLVGIILSITDDVETYVLYVHKKLRLKKKAEDREAALNDL